MASIFDVANSAALRSAIQLAQSGDTINLNAGTFSVLTLGKLPSTTPTAVPASGYIIQGNGRTVQDTRILQQNVDGPFGPGTVSGSTNNLNLTYTSGGAADRTALLRATAATYSLSRINISGVHRGWDGNGGLYMSFTSFTYANPVSVNFSLSSSAINITGQGGFNPSSTAADAGGSAFLHSWNNTGTVNLNSVNFNESGYLSSFSFMTFNSQSAAVPAPLGTYNITNSIFRRLTPSSQVARHSGNLLSNVRARLTGNTFQDGAYLDVRGDAALVTLAASTHNFKTVAGGYGIWITPNPGSADTNLVVEDGSELFFSGDGLPLRYVKSTPGVTRIDAGNPATSATSISIGSFSFQELIAAGQADDVLTPSPTTIGSVWISGDAGNDRITGSANGDLLHGGAGNDTVNGASGSDTIDGGEGQDSLIGGLGNDFLSGGAGNDFLTGDSGADVLRGNDGNDTLIGGNGDDTFTGGAGADFFRLTLDQLGIALDTITDFATADDRLGLFNIFGAAADNQILSPANFVELLSLTDMTVANSDQKVVEIDTAFTTVAIESGSFASVNAYVLIFNSTTGVGELWYDSTWSDNTGDRARIALLSSVTDVTQLASFTNNNFYAYA
jgi:Ca2+-binding RTX toxin-like protein